MSVPTGVVNQYAALRDMNRRTDQMAVALMTPAMSVQKAAPTARSQ
jgi:hypothetical protein